MNPKQYATPAAFRRALEDRLLQLQRKERQDLQRLRRQVAFDRLLGNGGIPHIVNTMLVFGRLGRIDLLPALPAEWPEGNVKGLLARGGFEVGITWAGSRLQKATIRSRNGGTATVRYDDRTLNISLRPGESATVDGALQRQP